MLSPCIYLTSKNGQPWCRYFRELVLHEEYIECVEFFRTENVKKSVSEICPKRRACLKNQPAPRAEGQRC